MQWCVRWRDKNKPEICGVYSGPWKDINVAHWQLSTFSSPFDLWVDEYVECLEFCECLECICPDCGVGHDECICLHDEYCGCGECEHEGYDCCNDPNCWCGASV